MVEVISHPKPSLIFDLPMVLFISFLILTLLNRMGLQRENTDTLLSALTQCNLIPPYQFLIGLMQ